MQIFYEEKEKTLKCQDNEQTIPPDRDRQGKKNLNLNQKIFCPASMGRMEKQYANSVNYYYLYNIYVSC